MGDIASTAGESAGNADGTGRGDASETEAVDVERVAPISKARSVIADLPRVEGVLDDVRAAGGGLVDPFA